MKWPQLRALIAIHAVFVLLGMGQATADVFIPASSRVTGVIVTSGLQGFFYDRDDPPGTLSSLALADAIIASSSPAATFTSRLVDYPKGPERISFLPKLGALLSADAATLEPPDAAAIGASPMVVRFQGVIRITEDLDIDPSNGTIDVRFALGSDDGSRLRIGGQTLISINGIGVFFTFPPEQIEVANFEAPGLYPVEIVWYDHFGGIGIEWYSSIPGGPDSGAPAGTVGIVPTAVLGVVVPFDRFVNPSGTCASSAVDGKPEHDTIQDAVNAADPGDKIGVCPGTYQENVLVNVANLSLLGIPPVILEPVDVATACLHILADGVQVRRFEIRGCEAGIRIGADSAFVANNVLHENGTGMDITGMNNLVMNNIVRNSVSTGIYVSGFSGPNDGTQIKNNTIRHHAGIGIFLDTTSGVTVMKNAVSHTSGPGIAVVLSTICVISFNSGAFNAPGINMESSDGCFITRNNFSRSTPGPDCMWDGFGTHTFSRNSCATEDPPGAWD
jgi:Right handed beta helix region